MKRTLIGRDKETRLLQEYLSSERSEFIAVYGRRRVGKTFLIRQVAGDKVCFSMTGMENADMQDQLTNFYFALLQEYPSARKPKSWIEAFYELQQYLESLPKGRKIIFIDY